MQIVLQRVKSASVCVNKQIVGSIDAGFLLLVGIENTDTAQIIEKNARKIANFRVFEDEQGKMNLSILQSGGAILSVSQFTLCANMDKGNRPGFDQAALPEAAIPLFDLFNEHLKSFGIKVETGTFGAHMEVTLVNDGPVTFIINHK
ncbi:MAG: D-aminoacyl-tRNA deacylase [Erysipelotrichaceae bacterium]|nr:D-aminoacyl-tRNA deacylase [Erysipelotrichaceae bacterium]